MEIIIRDEQGNTFKTTTTNVITTYAGYNPGKVQQIIGMPEADRIKMHTKLQPGKWIVETQSENYEW
jgi:hypothetical protein